MLNCWITSDNCCSSVSVALRTAPRPPMTPITSTVTSSTHSSVKTPRRWWRAARVDGWEEVMDVLWNEIGNSVGELAELGQRCVPDRTQAADDADYNERNEQDPLQREHAAAFAHSAREQLVASHAAPVARRGFVPPSNCREMLGAIAYCVPEGC